PAAFDATLGFLGVKLIDGDPGACDQPPAASDPSLPCRGPGDDPDPLSALSARFDVDLIDPGTGATDDGRLTFDELAMGPDFSDIVRFGFKSEADINLHTEVGVSGIEGLPKLVFDLDLFWSWDIGDLPEDPDDPVTNVASFSDDVDDAEPQGNAASDPR